MISVFLDNAFSGGLAGAGRWEGVFCPITAIPALHVLELRGQPGPALTSWMLLPGPVGWGGAGRTLLGMNPLRFWDWDQKQDATPQPGVQDPSSAPPPPGFWAGADVRSRAHLCSWCWALARLRWSRFSTDRAAKHWTRHTECFRHPTPWEMMGTRCFTGACRR